MARFGKIKRGFKSVRSRFKRARFSRAARPRRTRRVRKAKGLHIPHALHLGGMKIPVLALAAVAAYFFIAPVKAWVNKLIGKK